jgi:hypothetical protein
MPQAGGAKGVVATLPDVTTIPFTTIGPRLWHLV